jgi:hypothetical protein
MKVYGIYMQRSENLQRYVIEYGESEFDGKIDDFGGGCGDRRGGSPLPW